MFLSRLFLRDFRCFKERLFEFQPGMNLIQAENAQGKTSLLEALSLLSAGRSFRTLHLPELVRHGAQGFHLEAVVMKEGMEERILFHFDGKERLIRHNQNVLSSAHKLVGILPMLVMPVDEGLTTPKERRRFIDLYLAQSDTRYLYSIMRYSRALKQRNSLLRSQSTQLIPPWEEMMGEMTEYLMQARKSLIERLEKLGALNFRALFDEEMVCTLTYRPSLKSGDKAHEELVKSRSRDLLLGTTSLGPHRDDLKIAIGGHPQESCASEGQKRLLTLSLLLAQRQMMQETLGHFPLIAIDDFTAHLDERRSTRLREALARGGQAFLTTPHQIAPADIAIIRLSN